MTALLVAVFVGLTFFVAPYVGAAYERHRQQVRELNRCGRVRYITDAPRFTRDDPSPRPRRGDAA